MRITGCLNAPITGRVYVEKLLTWLMLYHVLPKHLHMQLISSCITAGNLLSQALDQR